MLFLPAKQETSKPWGASSRYYCGTWTLPTVPVPTVPQYRTYSDYAMIVENKGLQCVYSKGGHGNGIGD